jgi:RNA polymerase sigma factor (sigma-70 family)
MDGLLDSYAIPKRPGLIGIAATTAHKPTKETKDSLPTPPDIQACGFAKKETELTLALLTPAQQRMLRCIACITQKTSNIYGAEKAAVEACGGISPDARYGKKMQNLGLIEQHKGFQKVDTKNPARIFYSLTESGAKAANTLPENDDCQPPDTSPEPARVRDIVESCLHCIWSKQIAAGEPAAATAQMLSHCNGADTSQIRRNLSAIVNAGAARRAEGSPENTSDPKHQKLIVIPPAKLAKLRGASEHCKSSLYPDIPAAYLEPVLFGSLPGFEKSNDADIPTIRAFIELHRGQTLLTKEQVLDLGRTIQDPSTSEAVRAQAVTTFVERNVSLAVWYVQNKANFERLFLSFEDAVQEALLGIEASAKHFDPTFDVQFSTYTIFWMKQAVQRAAAAQAGVPSNPFVEMPLSYYAATDFEAIHGRPPTVIELAHARDTTPQVIRRMLKARQSIQKQGLSLDFAFDGNSGRGRMYGESTFHDIIGFTQSDFSSIETYEATHKLAKHLTAPERAMLGSILGYHKMSQALIGREFDMSRDRLKRSQERVTSLLRHPYFGIAAGHDRSQDWQLDAACAKSEMSAIVEDVNANAVVPSDVARMCGFCPVRAECFKSTLKTPVPVTAGIWAGFNPVQLREYRKRAQAARAKATR